MSDVPLYQLKEVQKSHGAAFTLHIPTLTIERGEVIGLLGPTGAGKSTLLGLLAGLESPDTGEVRFDGGSLNSADLPLKTIRRITLVHQRPLLLAGTVRFNVEYGLRLRNAKGISQIVDAMLDRLGLLKLASQSARTLSGGQTQLVALARALVIEPDILLLDEPTANLDPAHVALVEDTIQERQRDRGMSIVWATHNLFQARRVATRTGLLLNGQLAEFAPSTEFFERPADPRTADFVQGRMIY
ncbi:MAG: ATP-binding cassette domain-containing protein [Verrucomicrobia bacterium]|nr:ATP-binding cassette domain-containing protein [Verrucomicrobiota bacterium]